ncbi:hypothetical protein R3P38DRAFT_3440075 [Favolaschia claudopus]|uniref:Uncharacterized protein n=1 Tax=Favolaschia claudopus TaxID=2862362 RepID=A0AAW0CTV8_9AGAR
MDILTLYLSVHPVCPTDTYIPTFRYLVAFLPPSPDPPSPPSRPLLRPASPSSSAYPLAVAVVSHTTSDVGYTATRRLPAGGGSSSIHRVRPALDTLRTPYLLAPCYSCYHVPHIPHTLPVRRLIFYLHLLHATISLPLPSLARISPRPHHLDAFILDVLFPRIIFQHPPPCPHGRISTPRYLIGFLKLEPLRPRLPIVVRPPAPCHRHPLSISLPHVSSLCDRYLHLSSHSLLFAFSSTILSRLRARSLMITKADDVPAPYPCSTVAVDAVDADTGVGVDAGGGIGVGRARSPACMASAYQFQWCFAHPAGLL